MTVVPLRFRLLSQVTGCHDCPFAHVKEIVTVTWECTLTTELSTRREVTSYHRAPKERPGFCPLNQGEAVVVLGPTAPPPV